MKTCKNTKCSLVDWPRTDEINFCSKCGGKTSEAPKCPKCGREVIGDKFCGGCGYIQTIQNPEESADERTAQDYGDLAVEELID